MTIKSIVRSLWLKIIMWWLFRGIDPRVRDALLRGEDPLRELDQSTREAEDVIRRLDPAVREAIGFGPANRTPKQSNG